MRVEKAKKKSLTQQDNQILISFVNHHFGPIRGLNFIIKGQKEIEVKEYLCEIQTEHSIWKEMPRRMLRHRVIAQCARLAFGISIPKSSNQVDSKKINLKVTFNSNSKWAKATQMDKLKTYINLSNQ